MFVGHLALALGAKRAAPAVNLGWFMAGVTALDLLWPLFLLAGIEHVSVVPGATAFNPLVFDSYPWSHSLLMSVVWGVAFVGLARWRAVRASAILLAALVVSHWVLDFVTHLPDLPLWPGPSPRFGLGLWRSLSWTFIVEGAMWLAAIVVYLRMRPLAGSRARIAFWSLIVVTTAMWIAGPWSPPPPSENALAWFGLIGWTVLPWAALADRG
jgi:hypothetical protein